MSSTTVSILGLLAIKPMHGYDLNRLIKAWHLDSWAKIPVSTVYRRLKQVEKDGLVEAKVEQLTNMPPRTVFSLTPEGHLQLAALLIDLIVDTDAPEDHFKLASFFIGFADKDRVGEALETRCQALEGVIQALQAEGAALPPGGSEATAMLLTNSVEHLELAVAQTRRYQDILRSDPERFFRLYPQAPAAE